jgi:hypothetical protein
MKSAAGPFQRSPSRPVVLVKLLAGFGLLIIGGVLALPGVPGPGLAIVFLGLLLLGDHFAWARRVLAWLREKRAGLRWPASCSKRSEGKGRQS